MEIKKGIGVSPGVVIGTAVVLDAEDMVIPRRSISPADVPGELDRFKKSLETATEQLRQLRDNVAAEHGQDIGGIFNFHIGLLKDKSLITGIEKELASQHVTAEYAVSTVMRRFAGTFLKIQDKYFSERVKDIYDVERRLLKLLIGLRHEDLSRLASDVVVIAHDLLPSQTAGLDKKHVKGFATDVGGRTSHTAIVARAMGIPAVVGLGDLTTHVNGGDTVVIDGGRGVVIVNPDPDQLVSYQEDARAFLRFETELAALSDLPAETLDGHHVSLQANIEGSDDIEDALRRGATGVGLFRTEYLYLRGNQEPTEEDHYEAYADALKKLGGRPLVIRTLDLGADKYTQTQLASPERNPFLGDRSIRMCLHDIPMFKRQLRAIMRCTPLGDVRIMFPMISTMMELRQAQLVLRDVMEELEDEGIEFRRDIPVGMMIEVPSAALMAQQFAKEVNFFSIGTNDLIQYTLAADRTNEQMASLYSPSDPAVLRLIRNVIDAASAANIEVTACGEMSGDPVYTLLLIGMGLRRLSATPHNIPEVKKVIRSIAVEEAMAIADEAMRHETARDVTSLLREHARRLVPEFAR